MKIIAILLIFCVSAFGQDRTVMNRHKFYDTTKVEDYQKIKRRRLTAEVDSTGITMRAWGDECFMKINLMDRMLLNADSVKYRTINGSQAMRLFAPNYRFQMYINQGGNFEFDARVRNKGNKGRHEVKFNIETQGLVFYKQDRLPDSECQRELDVLEFVKNDPDVPQSEKDLLPTTIEEARRYMMPDSVEGCYVAYHSTKANNYIKLDGTEENYETGQAFVLYLPKVWDNNGDTTFGYVEIDTLLGEMTIGVDSTWKANAVHPVTFDPDFGYTTVGASQATYTDGRGMRNDTYQYTASTGDEVVSYSLHAHSFGSSATFEIGTYTTSTDVPNSRVGFASVTFNLGSGLEDWNTSASVTHALTNAVEYTVCYARTAASVRISRNSTSSSTSVDNSATTGVPATWSESGTSSALISQYATYTEGGGADPSTRRRKYLQGDR